MMTVKPPARGGNASHRTGQLSRIQLAQGVELGAVCLIDDYQAVPGRKASTRMDRTA